jgi:GT2 family glycosyltransferase
VDISVVSLTWNSAKYVDRFLESLTGALEVGGFDYEVFVIDNGSADGTSDTLKRWAARNPRIKPILLSKNTGTTFSRNIGILSSTGRYIAIMDSDMEVPPDAFIKWVKGFEEIPSDKVGIVAPKLLYPDGSLQISARRFPTIASKVARLFDIRWLIERADVWSGVNEGKIVPVPYAISAAWLVNRNAVRDIGLLDERIFYAPEDAEYCTRMWSKGWEVWYYPKAEIIHHTQRITKKKPLSLMGLKHIIGLLYYWIKAANYFIGW